MSESRMRLVLAVIVLASCSDGSGKHVAPSDSQAADSVQADGSIDAPAGSATVVATGMTPWAITVDDTAVYWSDLGLQTVSSIPIAGGSATTLAHNLSNATFLQHDTTNLYWGLTADVIAKIPLDGGTPVPLQTSNNTILTALAIDGANVYHTEDYTVAGDCSVAVVPKAGGTRVVLASGGSWNHPTGLSVGGGMVFWGVTSPGAILAVPVTGGTTTTLVSSVMPGAIVADATNVYWVDPTAGVMKVAQSGGTPVTLATVHDGFAIAVDDANVYWSTRLYNTPSTIYKVPIAGGTPVTVASAADMVNAIAVDATSIYWTENRTGAVRKAAK